MFAPLLQIERPLNPPIGVGTRPPDDVALTSATTGAGSINSPSSEEPKTQSVAPQVPPPGPILSHLESLGLRGIESRAFIEFVGVLRRQFQRLIIAEARLLHWLKSDQDQGRLLMGVKLLRGNVIRPILLDDLRLHFSSHDLWFGHKPVNKQFNSSGN